MPLLGYRFLNATNFISRAALRGKLLNLHFRESAEAAAQNQCTTESKLESSRQRDSYPKTSGSIPLSVKGGQWSFVPHGVENIAIWVYRGYDFTQNVPHVGGPSHHMYFKTILALSSHLRLIRERGLFVSSFPAKSLYNALLLFLTIKTC